MKFRSEDLQHYPIALAAIPQNWAVASVAEISTGIQPGFPSGKHNQEGRGVPHLRPMNISRHGSIDLSNLRYVEATNGPRLTHGDVLFNNTNSPALIGKTAAVTSPTDWAFSNHMTRIVPAAGIEYRYLAHHLQYLWMSGFFRHRCVNHVNQASISSGPLGSTVPLAIPPTAEQKRIVAAIEEQFSRLDAGVAALERVRQNLRRYRAAVLTEAVKGQLTERWRSEHPGSEPGSVLIRRILAARRQTREESERAKRAALGKPPKSGQSRYEEPNTPRIPEAPDLPASWSWTTTGYLCDCIVPNRDKPKSFSGDIPWITLPDFGPSVEICGSQSGFGLSQEEAERYRARVIPRGSVVMSCVGRFGVAAVLGRDAVINQQLHAFLVPSGLDARYLAYTIQTQKPYMRSIATSTTIAYLNKHNCNSVPIPVPPFDEQRQIVAEIEWRLSLADNMEHQACLALEREPKLRSGILIHAFSGKLVPQDRTDEPASVLLERIAAEPESTKRRKA